VNNDIVIALIGVLPQLIVVVVLAALGIAYRSELAEWASTHIGSVSAFGIKVELKAADVEDAVKNRKASSSGLVGELPYLASSGQRLSERATRLEPRMAGRTALWVDDHPERNHLERRLLNKMGLFVDVARSNDEAVRLLKNDRFEFDLLISDIKRDRGPSGLDLLRSVDGVPRRPQVIFYVTNVDPSGTPLGAHGITNRPDVLLDLVMDVIDRLPVRAESR
jgi:CheY-like chemotaxis protein